MSDPGLGAIVFLVALFLAVVGATAFVVAVRRGVMSERRRNEDQLANDSLSHFVAAMAAASNPGAGRHELGIHKIHGWILEYDPTVGGCEIQAVIGIDGTIHARRAPRSSRAKQLSASEWIAREPTADPKAAAAQFAAALSQLLAFDGVAREPGTE